jgi:hypothetical protein
MLCIDFGRAAANFLGHSFEPSGCVVVDINQARNGNDAERDPLFHVRNCTAQAQFAATRPDILLVWITGGKSAP